MTTTENIYPSAPRLQVSSVQEFRLSEIRKLKTFLNSEFEDRLAYYKRYKKLVNISSKLNAGFTGVSLATGIGGISILSVTAIAGIPIAVILESIALGSGVLSIALTFLANKLEEKAEKHERICTLASSKLNSTSDMVSKALEDSNINETEYNLIVKEHEKYLEMKKNLRESLTKRDSNELKKDLLKEFQKLNIKK